MSKIVQKDFFGWQLAWSNRQFRIKWWISIVAVLAILAAFPFFFQVIEQRSGASLNDWWLNYAPARDLSVPIFLLIWGTGVLLLVRSFTDPALALNFLAAYVLLSISRMTTILCFPLQPPEHLIALADPLSNWFYGSKFVTKDLFYSGHTSTIFLMYFCFHKPADRAFALVSGIVVGILLTLQHVHYSIDVLFAPLFAWICFWLASKWTKL